MTIEDKDEIESMEVIDIGLEQAEYLQTIGEGWAFPLRRFMNEIELMECLHMNTVTDEETGLKHPLSVPITQPITTEQKEKITGKSKVALKCTEISPNVLAVIEEPECFPNRKEEISSRTFGTQSVKHPKVERIMAQGDWLLSGKKMKFLKSVEFNDGMD